jgi:hypothetical protein
MTLLADPKPKHNQSSTKHVYTSPQQELDQIVMDIPTGTKIQTCIRFKSTNERRRKDTPHARNDVVIHREFKDSYRNDTHSALQ